MSFLQYQKNEKFAKSIEINNNAKIMREILDMTTNT